jgi:hypothetical protein
MDLLFEELREVKEISHFYLGNASSHTIKVE